MLRRLLSLLLAGLLFGCAAAPVAERVTTSPEEYAAYQADAERSVAREAAPAPRVIETDVEPTQEALFPTWPLTFEREEWLPYENAQAPPLLAQADRNIYTLGAGCTPFSLWFNGGRYSATQCAPRPSFDLPLQTSLVPAFSAGSGTPTYTRATAADQIDFEGLHHQVLSGEARFQGSRRVRNWIVGNSNDVTNASWSLDAGAARAYGFSDPTAGLSASRVISSGGANNGVYGVITGIPTNTAVVSAWLKGSVGGEQVDFGNAGATLTLTTSWVKYKSPAATDGFIRLRAVPASITTFYVYGVQAEDVTGQTNQNPSEYVSVGVLSAPYHGANVDGVKYFPTLNGNTVASNVVTEATGAPINSSTSKFGVLPGVGGSYFSTPSASFAAGMLDVRFIGTLDDWTPAGVNVLVSKWDDLSKKTFILDIQTNGHPHLYYSRDNAESKTATCDAAVSFADGTVGGVRATWAIDGTITFYTSADYGVTWTPLGSAVAGSAGANLASNDYEYGIGVYHITGFPAKARVGRVQVYVGGTLAVDFNPNKFTTAQTATMDTGEVWTANGGARVFGSTNATYGIPAMWDSGGPFGYYAESAGTQLVTPTADISDMTQAGWVGVTMTAAKTSTGPNGIANSASRLTATGASATILHLLVAAASSRTYSAYIRRVTGTGTVKLMQNTSKSADLASSINASTYTLVQFPANVDVTLLGYGIELGTSGDAVDVWNNQFEAGGFATSAMTTAGAARNADVLSYPTSGNISDTAGTTYAEIVRPNDTGRADRILGASGGNTPLYALNGASVKIGFFDGTNNYQSSNTAALGTLIKAASSWSGSVSSVALNGTVTTGNYDGAVVINPLYIGTDGGANILNGTIRKVAIWLGELSSLSLQQKTAFNDEFMPNRIAWISDYQSVAANDDQYLLRASGGR